MIACEENSLTYTEERHSYIEDFMSFDGRTTTFLQVTQPQTVHLEHHASSFHPHICHFEKATQSTPLLGNVNSNSVLLKS